MKTLFIYLLILGSVSAIASECYVKNKAGVNFVISEDSGSIDTGVPFGIVKLYNWDGKYQLSSVVSGEQSIAYFSRKLEIIKQIPEGISVDRDAHLGSISCK